MSETIRVKVLFFGAVADEVGRRVDELEVRTGDPSKSIFDRLLSDYPSLSTHKLLFSVNQNYATGKETLKTGDELAIFTAVSGG
jgi:molybdopterin converting factor small subunit